MWVPIWVKAAAVVTLIVGLALALIGMLNFFRFEQTLRATTEARLAFIAKDLKANIQTGLDLGLDLSSMSNVQNIIAREAATDPRILGIDVFGDHAQVLFSTEEGAVESQIPEAWRAAIGSGGNAVWQASDHKQMVVGTRLTSNFGADVGGVALRYSRASFEEQLQRMLNLLVRLGIATWIVTALLSVVVSWLVFGSTARRLARVRSAVESALAHPEGPAFQPGRHPLEQEYALADQSLRDRLRRAAAGSAER
jgi:hypothetical protein